MKLRSRAWLKSKTPKPKNCWSCRCPSEFFSHNKKPMTYPFGTSRSQNRNLQNIGSTFKTRAKTGGRMIYRPSNNASLGILGETTKEAATKEESSIALRWFLANAPHDWNPEEVTAWAQDRGFLNICGVQRHGRRTWFFRGHAPSGINNIDTKQGFSFSSGITLAPARAKPRNREEAAKVQTVRGAPEPAPNPSLVAIPF